MAVNDAGAEDDPVAQELRRLFRDDLDSIHAQFTYRRPKWGQGKVAAGPSQPAEPFKACVELIDEMTSTKLAAGPSPVAPKEREVSVRVYRVQMVIEPDDVGCFADIVYAAEDRLSEKHRVNDIEPDRLSVERRPDGTVWATVLLEDHGAL